MLGRIIKKKKKKKKKKQYCCDSGKPHLPVPCSDCGVDLLASGKALSKYCTASGKLHHDSKSKEVNLTDLNNEDSRCPFCGYGREEHSWCTETGWSHSEISNKYKNYKQINQQPAARGVVVSNVKPIAVTVARGKAPAPITKPENLKRPKIAVPPANSIKVQQPLKTPVFTDGSFLMSGITPDMRILFVGEGNFSFSRTIGKRVFGESKVWSNMVATDLELLAGVNNPGHQLTTQNLIELLRMGTTITFGVDATRISQTLPNLREGVFDLVTFQFPHNADKNFPFYPFPKGLPLESVGSHREMLSEFLKQASIMLREGGRACITTKTSEPYKSWEVDMLCEPPMWFTRGDLFDQEKWAQLGYSHINTVNKCVTSIDGALTYVYVKILNDDNKKKKFKKKNRFTKDSTGCVDPDQGTFQPTV